MYKLVIAEKPSVAKSIANVIGATNQKNGYFEGNGYLVSWCIGHLVELAMPEFYDEKYKSWKYEDLPILPNQWEYQISEDTKEQFEILKSLMRRYDVDSLVEATDAGREGELIFRLVYQQAGCRKPFERLWISSMEDKAIEDGFAHLKDGVEYDALYKAALCRERADWLVGMNATRLFSTLYGQTLQVGRVMTPTLAMLVMREAEISAFKPESFYNIEIQVGGIKATSERMKDKEEALEVLKKVQEAGEAVIRKNQTMEKREKPPKLYDLTSLQRDANKQMGFSAKQTLDYAQSLYEKKLITYPRTDSQFLTEDMELHLPELSMKMADKFAYRKGGLNNYKQVINSKKVSDHHAIIPTVVVQGVNYGELPSGERKILRLIVARFLATLGEDCITEHTELELACGGYIFKSSAKKVMKKGWREVEEWVLGRVGKKDDASDENFRLRAKEYFAEGKSLKLENSECKEGKTTPKKHFTEDTLLSAMERAGAEEMPEDAERKGIGTPATRAGIIEKLVRIGLVERKTEKKNVFLIPTHKGISLVTVMPEQIQSASMTAEWEEKLLNIEKQKFSPTTFMEEIETMITELVQTYEVIKDGQVLMNPVSEPVGACPCCGKQVVEKTKGYFCESKECDFALWKENRFFETLGKELTKPVAEKLLMANQVWLGGCRSKKSGKSYDCIVTMQVDSNGKPQFGMEFERSKSGKRKEEIAR